MTFCTIVGIIVSCLIDPSTKPTAAQAAAILASHPIAVPAPAVAANGPTVTIGGGAQAPRPIEPRRLDGSSPSQPPAVYGVPFPYSPFEYALLQSLGTRHGSR